MSAFEFVFSLFVLLLGFSLVEVLSGFARVLNGDPEQAMGWLTPMLAVFVMLDVTGFWSLAWQGRAFIPPTYAALIVGLAIAGLYYIAASMVFPGHAAGNVDLDGHYFRVKTKVLTIVLVCQMLVHLSRFAIVGRAAFAHWSPAGWVIFATYAGCLIVGIFLRARTGNLIILSLLVVLYLLDAVISAA
jgi:hypothetical protein